MSSQICEAMISISSKAVSARIASAARTFVCHIEKETDALFTFLLEQGANDRKVPIAAKEIDGSNASYRSGRHAGYGENQLSTCLPRPYAVIVKGQKPD